jgi:hypothetical protein
VVDRWCGNFCDIGRVGVCVVYEDEKATSCGSIRYTSVRHASRRCVGVVKYKFIGRE